MKLRECIENALNIICPERVFSLKRKSPEWWSTELSNTKGLLRQLNREWKYERTKPNPDTEKIKLKHAKYKALRSKFDKDIKDAKKLSWRTFTSKCEDIYLLNKIIFKKQQNSISMIESCNTGKESNNALLDTYFPGSVRYEQDIHTPEELGEETKTFIDLKSKKLDFLNPTRVKEAFQDMTAHNSGVQTKQNQSYFKTYHST